MRSFSRGVVRLAGRLVLAAAWLAAAAAVALGAAGLAAAVDHRPGTVARPELTWSVDRSVRPALEGAVADLTQLSSEVDRLSVLGRGALAAITARDTSLLETTLAEGGTVIEGIELRASRMRQTLEALPGFGPGAELRVGAELRSNRALLLEALETTSRLRQSWAVLTNGGLTAATLVGLLEAHDEHALAATAAGRQADYRSALVRVEAAEASLAEAERVRDRLSNTVDVGTLDEWLHRNREYDAALARLYGALLQSGGLVNDDVREAIRLEEEARGRLPPDTRGLVIIVAEVGRGGANQAVIEIERVRGTLAEALARLDAQGHGDPD